MSKVCSTTGRIQSELHVRIFEAVPNVSKTSVFKVVDSVIVAVPEGVLLFCTDARFVPFLCTNCNGARCSCLSNNF